MGHGRKYAYPRWVWSPTGGWWVNSPYATRFSVFAISVGILAGYGVLRFCQRPDVLADAGKFGYNVSRQKNPNWKPYSDKLPPEQLFVREKKAKD